MVTWRYNLPKQAAPYKIKCGDSVTFNWNGTFAHDIVLVPGDTCNGNTTSAVEVEEDSKVGSATVKFTKPGIHSVICTVPGHCPVGGMKRVYDVGPCPATRKAPPPRHARKAPKQKKPLKPLKPLKPKH